MLWLEIELKLKWKLKLIYWASSWTQPNTVTHRAAITCVRGSVLSCMFSVYDVSAAKLLLILICVCVFCFSYRLGSALVRRCETLIHSLLSPTPSFRPKFWLSCQQHLIHFSIFVFSNTLLLSSFMSSVSCHAIHNCMIRIQLLFSHYVVESILTEQHCKTIADTWTILHLHACIIFAKLH